MEKTISVTVVDREDDQFHLFGEDDAQDMIYTVSADLLCSALGVSTNANIFSQLGDRWRIWLFLICALATWGGPGLASVTVHE